MRYLPASNVGEHIGAYAGAATPQLPVPTAQGRNCVFWLFTAM